MGKSGDSEHKEKSQKEVDKKIVKLLSSYEKVLNDGLIIVPKS